MLKASYSELLNLIVEKSGLSESEINEKVELKLKQLSDLISKEGAAYIIANELGLKLLDTSSKLQIKNILVGMRNVEVAGKVTRLFELRTFQTTERTGKVASFFIGDETGQIRITMWGDQADNINKLKEGDLVKIKMAYVRENNGFKELHLNEKSSLTINPLGLTVGEVKQTQSRPDAQRKFIKELLEGDENTELLGTVVQVYDPRFFEVCPECGRRVRNDTGSFVCQTHKEVTPKFSYVFNIFLDDGTDNIRAVFFKNQAEKLFKKTEEEILSVKNNQAEIEELKNSALGNQIKIIGRVKKNEMFDRLEFTANLVYTDINPDEEVKKLDEAIEKL